MITNNQFDQFKQELNTIIDLYKKEFSAQIPTDWQTYEKLGETDSESPS
jgi:hypothetical protein